MTVGALFPHDPKLPLSRQPAPNLPALVPLSSRRGPPARLDPSPPGAASLSSHR
jgi:hypothetical protein